MTWFRGASVGSLVSLHVAADPAPESLRISRQGRVYHGKNYGLFYAECQRQLAVQRVGLEQLTGPLSAVIETVSLKPKTSKRSWPVGDTDNMAKGPLDAVTKTEIWVDDDLVQDLHVFKRFASSGEAAGTFIHIARLS